MQRTVSIDPLAPSSAFDERLQANQKDEVYGAVGLDENLGEEERLLVRDCFFTFIDWICLLMFIVG
jgi:hypothetical protein